MTLELAEDRPPIPPADLILRIAQVFGVEDIDATLQAFDLGALEHLRGFERALACVGRSIGDFDQLLDFGCGCGRFLRHLGQLADQVEIHGTDIDAEMLGWVEKNLAFGHYVLASPDPPLPYPDGHFDLIINHSVFTHLDEDHQDRWLAELQRITRPGGIALLTVFSTTGWNALRSTHSQNYVDSQGWRRTLENEGILFIADDSFIGSTHPDSYHSTFHAPWYVFEHWSRFFDVAAYIPNGSDTQDLVVVRRREITVAPEPIRARPGHERRVPKRLSRGTIHDLRARLAPLKRLNPVALSRELDMLRAGVYEQGNRISVLGAELRREIDAARNAPADEQDH